MQLPSASAAHNLLVQSIAFYKITCLSLKGSVLLLRQSYIQSTKLSSYMKIRLKHTITYFYFFNDLIKQQFTDLISDFADDIVQTSLQKI